LIQEPCIAEEVSIDESVSSKPNISVQRSSYSQNRFNSSSSELNHSDIKSSIDSYSKLKDNSSLEFKSNVDSFSYIENRNSSNRSSQEFNNNNRDVGGLFRSNITQNRNNDTILKNNFYQQQLNDDVNTIIV